MIRLRKQYPVLINGTYKTLENDNDHVFSFERFEGTAKMIIVINLSEHDQEVAINIEAKDNKLKPILGFARPAIVQNAIKTTLSPTAIEVWQIR